MRTSTNHVIYVSGTTFRHPILVTWHIRYPACHLHEHLIYLARVGGQISNTCGFQLLQLLWDSDFLNHAAAASRDEIVLLSCSIKRAEESPSYRQNQSPPAIWLL